MSLVSLLGSDMRRCISIIILSVEVVAGLYEHLQDVETIREAGRQMQSIVSLLICVIDIDTVFS